MKKFIILLLLLLLLLLLFYSRSVTKESEAERKDQMPNYKYREIDRIDIITCNN